MANYLDLTTKSQDDHGLAGSNPRLPKLSGQITPTRLINTIANHVLHDYHSGKTVFVEASGGTDYSVVLPAPRYGLNFVVINTLSPTGSGDVVITNAGGNHNMIVQGPPTTFTEGAVQIVTFTFAGALVALNKINITQTADPVFGSSTAIMDEEEFTTTSDATLQAIATAIALLPNVATAVVTVVGGNQTGSDDRVITVTGQFPGANMNLTTPVVTLGSGQVAVGVAITQQAVQSGKGGDMSFKAASSVTIEAASVGGEWLDFRSTDTKWYCRVSHMNGTNVTVGV